MKYSLIVIGAIIAIQVMLQYFELHHYNAYIDRFFWDTSEFFVSLFVLVILILLYSKIKKPLLKYLYLILPTITGFICLFTFGSGCILVSEAQHDYKQKMYFHSEGEWNYYARTWRRSALDDLNIFVRKERDIGIGFYIDKRIDNAELEESGFNHNAICDRYRKYYFDIIK